MNMRFTSAHISIFLLLSIFFVGCDSLFGSKDNETTEEIFDAGRIEPQLVNEVEYVPLFPFFTQSGNTSTFSSPQDIYVGYDELIYVVDNEGLHTLDLAGRPAAFIPIEGGGTSVIQDRRFHVYVTARRDTTIDGNTWNLPVILHYADISIGAPKLVDVIWHPFDDDSRKFNRPDPIPTDEEVDFTGVAVLDDNSILASRRGPVNDRASVILPHNIILKFSPEGFNSQAIVALNPSRPSLRSAINPADVISFVHPPQRQRYQPETNFILAQSPYTNGATPAMQDSLPFAVLSIRAVETTDGIAYQPDTQKIIAPSNPNRGDGFMYEEFKFLNPSDLTYAADETNYIFVLDAGRNKLFVFTSQGIEGVAPPPASNSTKPVIVSFGSLGDGALQFNNPNGVAYFDRIVYVADTGNHRISRFRLNTDFE